jgi:hypothetical protein
MKRILNLTRALQQKAFHKSERSLSLKSNYQICEAINCYEIATEEADISVGKFGIIRFNLCHECSVKRFGKWK